eukprot:NODE_6427_length_1673_cov_9.184347.p1 GENE.NODE_6427_length_1673_cov_9.184347~~NODE_6427_length_1673_cov_9.184347.p1  ORF type:complete len:272 (-),score=62.76 NODE_6427_length_1673_cov_9.184347:858-1586(-)
MIALADSGERFGTVVGVRTACCCESADLSEAVAVSGLAAGNIGKMPTVVSWRRPEALLWLVSFHFKHPAKNDDSANKRMIWAAEAAISQHALYSPEQWVICGMDGNDNVAGMVKLFKAATGPLRCGELLSCGDGTISKVVGIPGGAGPRRLDTEESDYLYIAGQRPADAVHVTYSRCVRGPLLHPFHCDGSADFLLEPRAPPLARLEAVAASDHSQVTAALTLFEEPATRPMEPADEWKRFQ